MAKKMVTIGQEDLDFLSDKALEGLEAERARVKLGERFLDQDRKKLHDLSIKIARMGNKTPRAEIAACKKEIDHTKEMIAVHEKCICAGPIIDEAIKRVTAIKKQFRQP